MKSNSPLRTFRSVLATTLMLWFAGAGCLFVSYAHGALPGSDAATESACPAHQPAGNVSLHHATNASEPVAAMSSDTVVVDSGHSCCKIQAAAAAPKLHTASTSELANSIAVARQTRLTSLPPPAGAMNCCPLMSTAVAAVSKPRANEATTTAVEPVALTAFLNQQETASKSTPLRLPNRGHTYLHCCAFLI
ncbi:MAG: hypothetical protein QOE77_554 [Blastocatellia bacterium]|nr:hypothetical protein [Blastocatellia bacterium]